MSKRENMIYGLRLENPWKHKPATVRFYRKKKLVYQQSINCGLFEDTGPNPGSGPFVCDRIEIIPFGKA